MCASAVLHGTTRLGHESDGGSQVFALNAVFQGLTQAVQMTGAQGATITRVTGGTYRPLMAVQLSSALAAALLQQMSEWTFEEGTSVRLIGLRGRSPLFALCIAAKTIDSQIEISFIMTGENQLEVCSLDELERLAMGLASTLESVYPSSPLHPHDSHPMDEPIPACCICGDFQNEAGQWGPWQRNVNKMRGRMLTHTFCPRCVSSNYPELQGVA